MKKTLKGKWALNGNSDCNNLLFSKPFILCVKTWVEG